MKVIAKVVSRCMIDRVNKIYADQSEIIEVDQDVFDRLSKAGCLVLEASPQIKDAPEKPSKEERKAAKAAAKAAAEAAEIAASEEPTSNNVE